MNAYHHDDYAAFIAAMRADPDDRITPLVCADWLEEHGKGDHAKFIRGCVRIAELRDILDECAKMDLHYTDLTRAKPADEKINLVHQLERLISPHSHEWTAGYVRRWLNPTVYDWSCGFLRSWSFFPYESDSDRRSSENNKKKLKALLARQPIVRVEAKFPRGTFAPPLYVLEQLAHRFDQFPGLRFTHKEYMATVPVKEGATHV